MADEDVAWYQRLHDAQPDLLEFVWCWTVVQPLTRPVTTAEVARRLGADPATVEQRAGWDFDEPDGMLHLHQVGSVVVMCQAGAWEGVRDEALRWLSDGACVHSSAWSGANVRSVLCYAAFGVVLTRLQYLDDEHPGGRQPTALDEDRAALREEMGYPAHLALIERRTGVRLDPAWLDQPHDVVVIRTPIPDDPRPPGMFGSADPDLAAMFLLADESTQRAALRWVLDLLADELDLRGEAPVRAVLDALRRKWPSGGELSDQLSALRSRLNHEVNTSPGMSPERWRHYYRMRAAEAFAAAVTASGGRSYPPEAFGYAQHAVPQRWPTIRTELRRRVDRQRR